MSYQRALRRVLVAWAVGVAPLCLQMARLGSEQADAAIRVGIIGLATLLLAYRSRLGAIAIAAAGIIWLRHDYVFFEPRLLFVMLGQLLVAGIATGVIALPRAATAPAGPTPGQPSAMFAAPAAVSAAFLMLTDAARFSAFVLALGMTFAAIAVAVPKRWNQIEQRTAPATRWLQRLVERVDHGIAAFFKGVGAAASAVLLGAVFVLAVLLPWAVQRIVRWDPTRPPSPRGTRWVPRRKVLLRAGDPWIADPAQRPVVRRRRAPYQVGALIAAVALVVAVWVVDTGDDSDPDAMQRSGVAARLQAEPWFPEWNEAWTDLMGKSRISQFTGLELHDLTSKFLNVRDGRRTTWNPPKTCPAPFTVWMYGGSTLFGVGQRDDHTLASELSRVASDHGVDLVIENAGVGGDVSWQQQRRLERDLAVRTDAPDLVVFYDGFNDMRAPEWAYLAGQDPTNEFTSFNDSRVLPIVDSMQEQVTAGKHRLVASTPKINVRPVNERIVQDAIVFQYTATHTATRQLLALHDVPFLHFFQPARATRATAVAGDFPTSRAAQRRFAKVRQRLPEGVIDIADAFDDSDRAVYVDDVHTNEAGNVILADRIWEDLGPKVAELTSESKASPCS